MAPGTAQSMSYTHRGQARRAVRGVCSGYRGVLLLIPPVLHDRGARLSFESQRWRESDYRSRADPETTTDATSSLPDLRRAAAGVRSAVAEYRGWSFCTRVNEVKNVPKTVRDNPGAYRSHYGGYSRYVGGK